MRDLPVVSSGGNRSNQQKPPPNPKSLATYSHAQTRIQTHAMVRDRVQSVAMP